MGCDIHMYVEYKKRDQQHWQDFGGRINPGRNYAMFGLLSKGVRTEFDQSFPAKGMPNDPGYESLNDNREWIKETRDFKPHPDWHSHSWLSFEEYERALEIYRTIDLQWQEPEYEAVLSAMKCFEEMGYESRIVFWFDN